MNRRQWTDAYHYRVDDDGLGAEIDFTDRTTRQPGVMHLSMAQVFAMANEMSNKVDKEGVQQ